MMRLSLLLPGLAAAMAVLLAVSGCSKSSRVMFGGDSRAAILSVRPAAGATDVPVTASIELVFNVPMDTGSVRANLCILGGEQVQVIMDSMAGMHASMHYSQIMEMRHEISIPGHLEWNAGRDSCRFSPDSAMQANTGHMIFLGRNAGCQMGNRNQLMGSDWICHFTTGR